MTPGATVEHARTRMVRRLRRMVSDARKAGLVLVTDADAVGVRVLTEEEHRASDDLRKMGELVTFEDGCGGCHAVVSGPNLGVTR